jgi:dolichyl-phosphate-mannose--protein O-mannosyl transferase
VYLLAELLLEDYALALGAAAFTVLNNFLYVFSRTAMMDIFLMAFAVWGMIFFAAALKWKPATPNTRRGLLVASGALIGMACASKWNGVDELCVAVLIVAVVLLWPAGWKNMEVVEYQANLRAAGIVWIAASYLLIPFVIYFATYWPYCRMLGVPYTASTVRAMNVYVWRFHLAVIGNPPIITRWYTWPLSTQPMRALSYLVLNWYVMVVGLAAGIYCLKRFAQNLPETLIVLLYAANLLQWAVTPQKCLYYYYYFPAATFLGLAIPIALYRLPPRFFGVRLRLFSVLPALLVFAYCFGRTSNLLSPYDCILGCWP